MSTATDVEEDLDLADLDLLEDDAVHASCPKCYPKGTIQLMEVFDAICGRRAIRRRRPTKTPPDDACPDCLKVQFCPKCGLRFGWNVR